MFPYFGRKYRLAPLYPSPAHPLIIEPFAGSMAYSLHHRPEAAIGLELDERVVALWQRFLDTTDPPSPPPLGSRTDDLLVKLCSYSEHALTSGTMTVTSRMLRDWSSVWSRGLEAADWARTHVKYRHRSYEDAPDVEACWFIDPPYQVANRRGYRYGADAIDYQALRDWTLSRRGQIIVCEQEGADWLPFLPLADVATHRGSVSREVIWATQVGDP